MKQNILLTVDCVIFTIIKDNLKVLLIKREYDPFKGERALPGGFVLEHETLDQAAYRELKEETNLDNVYLEQLYTFGDIERDPRSRVVTVTYIALTNGNNIYIKAGSDANETKFFNYNKLPKLAFDHQQILSYAYQRLKYKLGYTNIAQFILPAKFTLKELQNSYEIIFNEKFDIRNFRKKFDKLNIIKPSGDIQTGVKHRPAALFEFQNKEVRIVEIL